MSTTSQPGPIEWEMPPQTAIAGRRPSKWQPVADALRANPGRWAKISANQNTGIKSVILAGKLVCFRPVGAFEAKSGNHTDRWTGDVYARYIGSNGEYA